MKYRPWHATAFGMAALSMGLANSTAQTLLNASTPSGPIFAPANRTPAADLIGMAAPNTLPYTVVKGDSWTRLADKWGTTRKKLRALNASAGDQLIAGQIIQQPATKKALAAHKRKISPVYAKAQPVQDFDIPASTFASCPPSPSETDAENDSTTVTECAIIPVPTHSARVAKLVSPAELVADAAKARHATELATARLTLPVAPKLSLVPPALPVPAPSGWAKTNPKAGSPHVTSTLPNPRLSSQTQVVPPARTDDWSLRFLSQARTLGDRGIEYNEDWRPPGESYAWTMDCSNTSRYLYKVTTGINLPRTASDQYYYLHLQGKAWDVPTIANGLPDTTYLRERLKPGDLLFWENTYRPERQPPITHVMVFLGTNAQGQWIMAGSQGSRGGEHNRRRGGPDVYVFRPSQPCGGYTTWLGLKKHVGRFCAFGRPLEADPSKFASRD